MTGSRKFRIGLFLSATPLGGGVFQYSLSVLDAVAALPKAEYDLKVLYISSEWARHTEALVLPARRVKSDLMRLLIFRVLLEMKYPISAWRQISHRFHPVMKDLWTQARDLWLFPVPDRYSYQTTTPSLVAIHDLMHRYEKTSTEVAAKWTYRNRERTFGLICKWAKGVLADSQLGKKHIHHCYGKALDDIHVLPFAVPRYISESASPPDFDAKYSLPEKFFFYPAQFWSHKNHLRLIKALALVKANHPDVTLILAGARKNEYQKVRKLVERLGLENAVQFLGYVTENELVELYRRARALIMPTLFGPTNIPPLEANSLGCPVAISRIYAIPDQLGEAATYFDPLRVEEIADAMDRLWVDNALCEGLRKMGFRMSKIWSQSHFNDRLAQILADLRKMILAKRL